MSDWRQHHANMADEAIGHDLVLNSVADLLENLGKTPGGLEHWGILKVAAIAAQVARAQALGFEPDLLRLTTDEADAERLRFAQMAAETGKPVWMIPRP